MAGGEITWLIPSSVASKGSSSGLGGVDGPEGGISPGPSERGGGGSGAFFASPMRRRVMVSWAFVGTCRRIELIQKCQ